MRGASAAVLSCVQGRRPVPLNCGMLMPSTPLGVSAAANRLRLIHGAAAIHTETSAGCIMGRVNVRFNKKQCRERRPR